MSHTFSCYSRSVDMLNGAYHYIDLTSKGRDEADHFIRCAQEIRSGIALVQRPISLLARVYPVPHKSTNHWARSGNWESLFLVHIRL